MQIQANIDWPFDDNAHVLPWDRLAAHVGRNISSTKGYFKL